MATIQLQRGFEELTAYAAYTLGPDAQTERTDRESSEGRGTSSAAAVLSKVFLLSDNNGNLIGGPTRHLHNAQQHQHMHRPTAENLQPENLIT